MTNDKFKRWSLSFTMKVLTLLTIFWFIFMIYSGFLMIFAIWRTGEFSFLDTYITKICDCFMAGVITGLITRTVGNVFEFNDGSFMGKSIRDTEVAISNSNDTIMEEEIDPLDSNIEEEPEDIEEVDEIKESTVTTTKKKKSWFLK